MPVLIQLPCPVERHQGEADAALQGHDRFQAHAADSPNLPDWNFTPDTLIRCEHPTYPTCGRMMAGCIGQLRDR